MHFLISYPVATTTTIISFLLLLYAFIFWIPKFSRTNNNQNRTPPAAAGAWPVIGHIHLLGGLQPLHIKLGSWSEKYGPIFSMKLGVHQTFVISDSKLAKECFTTNDKILATRPKSLAVELMGYNYALFGLSPYGPYWRQVRKIVMLEFLSNRRVEMVAKIQVSEIRSSIKHVYNCWLKKKNSLNKVKLELIEYFEKLILNSAVGMLVGQGYLLEDTDGVRFQKGLKKLLDLLGTVMVSDVIPYLRWLDLGGYEKIMREQAKEMDEMLEVWLKAHRAKRDSGIVKDEEQDFMDALLGHVDGAPAEDFPGFDADTVIKAVCLTLLSGATETVTVTLTWAISLLLNHPHALKMAQDELAIHVGRDRQVEASDINKLIYLQAIIKETLRLYPAAALGVPHEAIEDCVVGGYNVPKGTRVFINIWKIHHDPQVWSEPDEFKPERFLTSHNDVDLRGQNFELIPFGSGRRMCPGMSFGLQAVQLTVASLIHGFEFTRPSNEPIDMKELPGLTNVKATPLEVLLSPRLSADIYG